ncbi:hypothetical protein O0L34_g1510 [Tuta absoluta]|nr:hypothetical protein O0L34_g1510 [Tuta absoluta]
MKMFLFWGLLIAVTGFSVCEAEQSGDVDGTMRKAGDDMETAISRIHEEAVPHVLSSTAPPKPTAAAIKRIQREAKPQLLGLRLIDNVKIIADDAVDSVGGVLGDIGGTKRNDGKPVGGVPVDPKRAVRQAWLFPEAVPKIMERNREYGQRRQTHYKQAVQNRLNQDYIDLRRRRTRAERDVSVDPTGMELNRGYPTAAAIKRIQREAKPQLLGLRLIDNVKIIADDVVDAVGGVLGDIGGTKRYDGKPVGGVPVVLKRAVRQAWLFPEAVPKIMERNREYGQRRQTHYKQAVQNRQNQDYIDLRRRGIRAKRDVLVDPTGMELNRGYRSLFDAFKIMGDDVVDGFQDVLGDIGGRRHNHGHIDWRRRGIRAVEDAPVGPRGMELDRGYPTAAAIKRIQREAKPQLLGLRLIGNVKITADDAVDAVGGVLGDIGGTKRNDGKPVGGVPVDPKRAVRQAWLFPEAVPKIMERNREYGQRRQTRYKQAVQNRQNQDYIDLRRRGTRAKRDVSVDPTGMELNRGYRSLFDAFKIMGDDVVDGFKDVLGDIGGKRHNHGHIGWRRRGRRAVEDAPVGPRGMELNRGYPTAAAIKRIQREAKPQLLGLRLIGNVKITADDAVDAVGGVLGDIGGTKRNDGKPVGGVPVDPKRAVRQAWLFPEAVPKIMERNREYGQRRQTHYKQAFQNRQNQDYIDLRRRGTRAKRDVSVDPTGMELNRGYRSLFDAFKIMGDDVVDGFQDVLGDIGGRRHNHGHIDWRRRGRRAVEDAPVGPRGMELNRRYRSLFDAFKIMGDDVVDGFQDVLGDIGGRRHNHGHIDWRRRGRRAVEDAPVGPRGMELNRRYRSLFDAFKIMGDDVVDGFQDVLGDIGGRRHNHGHIGWRRRGRRTVEDAPVGPRGMELNHGYRSLFDDAKNIADDVIDGIEAVLGDIGGRRHRYHHNDWRWRSIRAVEDVAVSPRRAVRQAWLFPEAVPKRMELNHEYGQRRQTHYEQAVQNRRNNDNNNWRQRVPRAKREVPVGQYHQRRDARHLDAAHHIQHEKVNHHAHHHKKVHAHHEEHHHGAHHYHHGHHHNDH